MKQVLLREVIGEILRDTRLVQGRTLREVSSRASISLGYLSELERGQKEGSSELLVSICDALDMSLSELLSTAAYMASVREGGRIRLVAA